MGLKSGRPGAVSRFADIKLGPDQTDHRAYEQAREVPGGHRKAAPTVGNDDHRYPNVILFQSPLRAPNIVNRDLFDATRQNWRVLERSRNLLGGNLR
jgi:hypothetical protein